ncbi:hypothetical protein EI613_32790 (plasmid) [Azospirillum sp. 412522]|nr:hypothetical protein [Azospirillum sp. 412522]MBY6266622.1 hypothetical protein [Azospirillum sp. 412522]
MVDSRIVDAVALVQTLAADPLARNAHRNLGAVQERALEELRIHHASPLVEAALGDLSIVIRATERAYDDEKVSAGANSAHLRKVLTDVIEQAEGIQEIFRRGRAGRHAQMQIEEVLLRHAISRSASAPTVAPSQLAKANRRVGAGWLIAAARRRRGIESAAKSRNLKNSIRLSEVIGHTPCGPSRLARDLALEVEAMVASDIDPTGRLIAAAKEVLKSLPAAKGRPALLGPSAGLVAAWACLELVEAWRPNGKGATQGDNSVLTKLVGLVYEAVDPNEVGRGFAAHVEDAVTYRNSGHIALAFAGRYSREQRQAEFENRFWDRVAAESKGSGPDEPDLETEEELPSSNDARLPAETAAEAEDGAKPRRRLKPSMIEQDHDL